MLINIGLFVGFFVQFQTFDQYFYMRQRTKVICTITTAALLYTLNYVINPLYECMYMYVCMYVFMYCVLSV